MFTDITAADWDDAVSRAGHNVLYIKHDWEQSVAAALPFVTFRHWRYLDHFVVRAAVMSGGRYTSPPFAEGSEVVATGESRLDVAEFAADCKEEFGSVPRLRINERFAPLKAGAEMAVVAHEDMVDLSEPILPRVRKTLRHTLRVAPPGRIGRTNEKADIDAAYTLYLRHMRSVRNFALPKQLFTALIRDHGGMLWTWSSTGTAPEAMAIFVPSDTEVLYSLSAASSVALSANVPHHLVYTALQHYQAQGMVRASLGATGVGSPLEVFKRGWRGEQFAIYELGARAGGMGRSSGVRDLVRYVPLSLYPLITTKAGKYLL